MGKNRYGVILDAGSSGTRVHVYKWRDGDHAKAKASKQELKRLPKLKTKKEWIMKKHPGVSTYGEHPTDVGEDYLKELLDHALSIVPAALVPDTPLFLMATAGMRLLPQMQQTALLSEICAYAKKNTKFSLPDCDLHIQVIPGETEGLYGWIAANYLVGGFDAPEEHNHGKGHHTYGFLDMGGASAQIAFAPNATESKKHANDLKLLRMRTLDGRAVEYKVFVATWLGFGVNQARQRYVNALLESYPTTTLEIPDPCLPSGLITSVNGTILDSAKGSEQHLLGNGLFKECMAKTLPLLEKDVPCKDDPCLINGQHVPAIDFDINHFIGVSEYWHSTNGFFRLSHKGDNYDFTAYQKQVKDFCGQTWDTIEDGVDSKKWGKKVNEATASEICFKASWLISMLHEGIGIPRLGIEKTSPVSNSTRGLLHRGDDDKNYLDPFQAVDKIDDTEVSWTLGKMVLYAAGQVEPSGHDGLPVGFGSNTGSAIPNDFQYAGSGYTGNVEGLEDDGDDDDDFGDHAKDLIKKNKHTSGFLILILILVFIGYVFRKKERRMRLYGKVGGVLRRSRRPGSPRKGSRSFFSNKLFGRSSSHYERVLEEGQSASDFELGSVGSEDDEHSDSSEGSHGARASGLATPKLNMVGFSESNFFDTMPVHGSSQGHLPMFPNAMDRSGLVVRTESRERLAPSLASLGSGRSRSRAGSPTRKSPLMNPVEED